MKRSHTIIFVGILLVTHYIFTALSLLMKPLLLPTSLMYMLVSLVYLAISIGLTNKAMFYAFIPLFIANAIVSGTMVFFDISYIVLPALIVDLLGILVSIGYVVQGNSARRPGTHPNSSVHETELDI